MNAAIANIKFIAPLVSLGLALGACDVVQPAQTAEIEQHGITMQGITMQGITMQGITMQGMSLQGISLHGATLAGSMLHSVHVDRGELVAGLGSTTLRGTALVGVHLLADVRDLTSSPPATAVAEFRITAVTPEVASYDPTGTGNTYLYTLEQWVEDSGTWQTACPVDPDGRSAAIPLAAIWDEHGDRIESPSQFTFGCTTGVIAKCYRWGYRPWVTGYGDLASMHWTCTRLARADYCGDGTPHTRNGTTINVWDRLPSPGPIQHHGLLPPIGMLFEAGWNNHGAVCLSHARWVLDDGDELAALCPTRLVPPGVGETTCDSISDALSVDSNAQLFNEAYLNLDL